MDYEKRRLAENIGIYVDEMQPLLSKEALFSDETSSYRIPVEPNVGETVTIRFRTKKNNVEAVILVGGDFRKEMVIVDQSDEFDYYATSIDLTDSNVSYYFEIRSGKLCCYFNKLGVTKDIEEDFAFTIIPGFHTPDWAKGAVMYQIYPDRFYNGDLSNDVLSDEYSYINDKVTREENWNAYPKTMDVNNFYGGDLQGIIDKLDYLQGLGVEVLYLNPIFVSPSNHKYDIQDYDHIDPHFGKIVNDDGGELLHEGDFENNHGGRYIKRVTNHENLEASNELFVRLSEEVHKRGMKIILDGVFNHCGSFNKWLDRECIYEKEEGYEKGAYISSDSPYRSFFKFSEDKWPYNDSYYGWWGHDTLPKLNYEESEKLVQDILRIAAKWVSPPYNADGWRLDVAADLGQSEEYNHQFWKQFRKAVKEANKDAIVLAEHYGDARAWLAGDEWDTVMNYDAFMEPISWFLTGMQKHSDEFREDMLGNAGAFFGAMTYGMNMFTGQSLLVAMNQLDNHDHSRFLTRTNHRVGRVADAGSQAAEEGVNVNILKVAVVMQMTWPGAPTLYYGDEAGVCGFTDPDNRRSYPWGNENQDLIEFYREIIKMHKSYEVFRYGSVKELLSAQNALAFGRFTGREQAITIVNSSDQDMDLAVPVWPTGTGRVCDVKWKQLFGTAADGNVVDDEVIIATAGIINIKMKSKGAVVLYHRNEEEWGDAK